MGGEATHAARALYEAVADGSDEVLWERLDDRVTWFGTASLAALRAQTADRARPRRGD